ncbi:MAG: DUF5721 family protein [bacterium]|nr:DUF5721 family protein [bacterium]
MYRKKDFMIALNILDIKNMMAQLLLRETFDNFYLEEASVTTFANLKINGRRNQEWYDTEERDGEKSYLVFWKEVRNILFQYIKGKKTPAFFSISLKLCNEEAGKYIQDEKVLHLLNEGKIEFLLHFRFEKEKLFVVTGSSQKEFIIDKMPENSWDMSVKNYMKQLNISYEE